MEKTLKKATFTALAIIPKDTDHIQTLRKVHDPAYERWPPHVNICFPFVDPEEFDRVFTTLEKELSTFGAFNIKFDKVGCFNKKTAVVFAQPETEDNNIQRLFDIVHKNYPQLDDAIKKSETGKFAAHLTLGKVPQSQVQKICTGFQENWHPVEYLCDQIYFLQRGKDTPMQIVRTLKLGQKP